MNKKLTRATDPDYRLFLGVIGGFIKYLNLDKKYLNIIRIIYVIFTVLTLHLFGFGIILYFLMAVMMPNEDNAFSNHSSSTNAGRKILHNVKEKDETHH